MPERRVLAFAICSVIVTVIASVQPADARRRVIDAGVNVTASGYCSPLEAAGSGCSAIALPFSVQIGALSYNSVYVNSNGVLSFGSIENYLAPFNSFTGDEFDPIYTGPPPATSLAVFDVPVFSPYFADGAGFFTSFNTPPGFDGNLAAETSLTGNSLTVNWFTCVSTVECGPVTADLVRDYEFNLDDGGLTQIILDYATTPGEPADIFEEARQNFLTALANNQGLYSLVLTDLSDGFMVDYRYNPGALEDTGTFGFNLPGSDFEERGPLTDRRFVFDGLGRLVAAPVPEPGTWATMLLGFAGVGLALRRSRRRLHQWPN